MINLKLNHLLIKDKRFKLKLTQQQVAQRTGMSTLGYSLVERGKKEPKANTIAKIATSLEEKIDYFFAK